MLYRYVGINPDTMANGRPLAHGDDVELTESDLADNQRLVRLGTIVPIPAPEPAPKPKPAARQTAPAETTPTPEESS